MFIFTSSSSSQSSLAKPLSCIISLSAGLDNMEDVEEEGCIFDSVMYGFGFVPFGGRGGRPLVTGPGLFPSLLVVNDLDGLTFS